MVEEKTVPTNNPAGRLYEILAKAIKIGKKLPYSKTREERKASLVLAEALEIENTDSREIFDGVSQLFRLIDDTELAIKKIKNVDTELYLSPIFEIKEAFGTIYLNLTEDWSAIAMGIDRGTLEKLKFCADMLSRQQGEIALNTEELTELYTDIKTLLERVLDAKIDEDIKSFLLNQLRDIEQAIINYKFKGSEGLIQVVQATLGATLMNENVRNEGKNPLVTNFFTIITRIASLLSIYSNTKQLSSDLGRVLQKLLPGEKDI